MRIPVSEQTATYTPSISARGQHNWNAVQREQYALQFQQVENDPRTASIYLADTNMANPYHAVAEIRVTGLPLGYISPIALAAILADTALAWLNANAPHVTG